ncbi:hypothetical protein [Noviherbaspirillum malthae]|uniref:hypothetical protein n=1 Tax=Noviherbaspirillum malthae TaxID=1260987 RepID=UPI00188DD6FF|nr:hypothetical protein [Noviherbaspirillum malthae]
MSTHGSSLFIATLIDDEIIGMRHLRMHFVRCAGKSCAVIFSFPVFPSPRRTAAIA